MPPLSISVVIPVFNCERYIGDAIRSVLAQTCPAAEIIVVDDGSSDQTRLALQPFRNSVHYIYQEHAGVGVARNRGVANCSGDLVAFLDADDLWLPDKLQLQLDYLLRHPDYALVYTDMGMFDETGVLQPSVKQWLGMTLPSGWIFRQLFAETLFAADSVLVWRQCLQSMGGFDESLLSGEDYHMWLRLARHYQFGCIDRPLLMYRQHPSMTTRTLGNASALPDGVPWEALVIEKVIQLYPEVMDELGPATVRKRLARTHFFVGCRRLAERDHRQARRSLARALRYCPWQLRYHLLYFASLFTPAQLTALKRLLRRPPLPQPAQQTRTGTAA